MSTSVWARAGDRIEHTTRVEPCHLQLPRRTPRHVNVSASAGSNRVDRARTERIDEGTRMARGRSGGRHRGGRDVPPPSPEILADRDHVAVATSIAGRCTSRLAGADRAADAIPDGDFADRYARAVADPISDEVRRADIDPYLQETAGHRGRRADLPTV